MNHPRHAEESSGPAPWTDAEIQARIDAYFQMLDDDQADRSFVKVNVYRELHERFPTRSIKAFERKMQNISAVMERNDLPWVKGLAPLRNVQSDLVTAIENRVADQGFVELGNVDRKGESCIRPARGG